ncbi:class I SAM-dependent methyltransferase [Mesorhizobium sp. ANAO-SY3R2]|uniref:class I SAM-dependent methyltransferase n=1 Tax=Mesorhizobium sp. ANAO-SY3R2 TaxID=3166644 RepID=UPI003673307B
MAPYRKLRETLGLRKKGAPAAPVRRATAEYHLHNELLNRSVATSADFIQPQLSDALIFADAGEIRQYAFKSAPPEGLLLEFGVYTGGSINQFSRNLAERNDTRHIHGFDAFLGLSEKWAGHSYDKMDRFNRGGQAPEVGTNVKLVKGWIDDTLPPFLERNRGPVAFVHIDTDTYSPCKTILTACRDRMISGTIILFDDMFCYPGWQHGEFKALVECLDPSEYTWSAFAGHCAMIIIK